MPYRTFSEQRLANYDGNKIVKQAYKKHITDFHITIIGKIIKVLPDDTIGIPHQRFVVQIPMSDQTVLVVHNLDYGKRLHLAEGDTLKISGKYVWNRHGGLIHLTHHDPNRKFEPGAAVIINEIHANPKPTVTPPRPRRKRH